MSKKTAPTSAEDLNPSEAAPYASPESEHAAGTSETGADVFGPTPEAFRDELEKNFPGLLELAMQAMESTTPTGVRADIRASVTGVIGRLEQLDGLSADELAFISTLLEIAQGFATLDRQVLGLKSDAGAEMSAETEQLKTARDELEQIKAGTHPKFRKRPGLLRRVTLGTGESLKIGILMVAIKAALIISLFMAGRTFVSIMASNYQWYHAEKKVRDLNQEILKQMQDLRVILGQAKDLPEMTAQAARKSKEMSSENAELFFLQAVIPTLHHNVRQRFSAVMLTQRAQLVSSMIAHWENHGITAEQLVEQADPLVDLYLTHLYERVALKAHTADMNAKLTAGREVLESNKGKSEEELHIALKADTTLSSTRTIDHLNALNQFIQNLKDYLKERTRVSVEKVGSHALFYRSLVNPAGGKASTSADLSRELEELPASILELMEEELLPARSSGDNRARTRKEMLTELVRGTKGQGGKDYLTTDLVSFANPGQGKTAPFAAASEVVYAETRAQVEQARSGAKKLGKDLIEGRENPSQLKRAQAATQKIERAITSLQTGQMDLERKITELNEQAAKLNENTNMTGWQLRVAEACSHFERLLP